MFKLPWILFKLTLLALVILVLGQTIRFGKPERTLSAHVGHWLQFTEKAPVTQKTKKWAGENMETLKEKANQWLGSTASSTSQAITPNDKDREELRGLLKKLSHDKK